MKKFFRGNGKAARRPTDGSRADLAEGAMDNAARVRAMSRAEKLRLCGGAGYWATEALPDSGIEKMTLSDGPHGLRRQGDQGELFSGNRSRAAVCFPTATAQASTWNSALLEELGAALADEARALRADVLLGPGCNIKRNPLCGRNFEYFSEDPYLSGKMAAAWIRGLQGRGIAACLKHFAANNQETERMRSDSQIDARTLHEIYLRGFEIAIAEAEPRTLMVAYNLLNGVYMSDNVALVRKLLRKQWGFNGLVMTDWGALNARDAAFRAGVDLEMPGSRHFFDQAMERQIAAGRLDESLVDESVGRLLALRDWLAARHGAPQETATPLEEAAERVEALKLPEPQAPQDEWPPELPEALRAAHHRLAKRIAVEGAVLLRNEGAILPLQENEEIALIGVMARQTRYQGGGSSHITTKHAVSLYAALRGAGFPLFRYAPGCRASGERDEPALRQAIRLARASGTVVLVLGLPDRYEVEGFDREHMSLPAAHLELVREISAVNPRLIVVLLGGSPVEMDWRENTQAILLLHLGGEAVGEAAADLLYGRTDPGGRLAETYPLRYTDLPTAPYYGKDRLSVPYAEGLYVGYRYFDKAGVEPAYPFGFGLGYTTFSFSALRLEYGKGDSRELSFLLKNTGERAGDAVAQIYVSSCDEGTYRPRRELRAFAKQRLAAGEEKRLRLPLDERSFDCYDARRDDWRLMPGLYAIELGSSSRDIHERLTVRVTEDGRVAARDSGETTNTNSGADTAVTGDSDFSPLQYAPDGTPLPDWYLRPAGAPKKEDFARLYARTLSERQPQSRGHYSMDSTMEDMQDNRLLRLILRVAVKRVFKPESGETPPLGIIGSVPLRRIVQLSASPSLYALLDGLTAIANGHFLRGLRRMR